MWTPVTPADAQESWLPGSQVRRGGTLHSCPVPTQPAAQGWASSAKVSVCVKQPLALVEPPARQQSRAKAGPGLLLLLRVDSLGGGEGVQGTILGLSRKSCVAARLTAKTPPAYTQRNPHLCPNQSKAPENQQQWIKNYPLLRTWNKKIPQYILVLKHPKTDY